MQGEVGISVKSAAKKQPKLLRSGEIESATGGGLKTANLSEGRDSAQQSAVS